MTRSPTLVLGRAGDVLAVASRLALGSDSRVLACLRSEDDRPVPLPVPAVRRSRELAERLGAAGLEAGARGALVVVDSFTEPAAALSGRIAALAGGPPVLALLRPRAEADDALIERSEVVLAAGTRAPAAELLLEEMDGRGIAVSVQGRRPGLADRLAGAGIRLGRLAGDSGQASVEAVALLPLFLAVALAVGQLLAAGVARELAGHAATAGAAAMIQGRDATAAARRALPGWSTDRASVVVEGRRVSVRLRPPGVPGVAALLEARGAADAGPAP